MHLLTVTLAPHTYAEWGWQNFQSWIHTGHDNYLMTPNGRIHRLLTGVGTFPKAMEALQNLRLISVIQELALRRKPLLAICLGMQLLLDESDEFGVTAGLGLIPGRVVAVPDRTIVGDSQKIPHIGWSSLQPSSSTDNWTGTLLQDNSHAYAVYFVHSFMAQPFDQKNRVAESIYGRHRISAMIGKDQITGCQFHPEKSGEVGLKILRTFLL